MLRSLMATALLLAASAAPMPAQEKAASNKAADASSTLDLNTATPQQLETLPGIGASTAARIVEYRQKNGGFKKIEELMNVRGIGEKSFLKLKPLITVSMPKQSKPGGSAGR
jgi:competence protein ComEA